MELTLILRFLHASQATLTGVCRARGNWAAGDEAEEAADVVAVSWRRIVAGTAGKSRRFRREVADGSASGVMA